MKVCKIKKCEEEKYKFDLCQKHYVKTWTKNHLKTEMNEEDFLNLAKTHPNITNLLVDILSVRRYQYKIEKEIENENKNK